MPEIYNVRAARRVFNAIEVQRIAFDFSAEMVNLLQQFRAQIREICRSGRRQPLLHRSHVFAQAGVLDGHFFPQAGMVGGHLPAQASFGSRDLLPEALFGLCKFFTNQLSYLLEILRRHGKLLTVFSGNALGVVKPDSLREDCEIS
jgi:hypothetical protein